MTLLVGFAWAVAEHAAPGISLAAAPGGAGQTDGKVYTAEEKYVRDHIKEYFRPTKVKFQDDGTVELFFDFEKKNLEHSEIFTPAVQKKPNSRFRWTLPGEDSFVSSTGTTGRSSWYRAGLRVSESGYALLNCWFHDDVEAEIGFFNHSNHRQANTAAVIFQTKRGLALGSNYGSEARIYSKGRPTRKAAGSRVTMTVESSAKFKLKVKDGKFSALYNGRERASLPYPDKRFESGKVGFLWGLRAMGTITRLTVKGRLDYEATAREMKKRIKLRRPGPG